ncbi:MAG TPA: Lrp/AsnC family transcriptional regulator [Candidatus Pelethocola excrementipullorum]|nr:Lrp/AsnC family transcriptional regulator [Candidatus Pelethocola excrementipullorum]
MDNTDIKIINILQDNCKTTNKEIGQQVGLTPPAVAERIRRLEDQGVIKGYHARINDIALGKHVSAFITVNVEPQHYTAFCQFCKESTSITEHHHIIGVYNSLLRVAVSDTHELEVLLEQLKKYGVSQTSTFLSTYFSHKKFMPGE